MIEEFVNDITLEQAKRALVDCLDILTEMEIVKVSELPIDGTTDCRIDMLWTCSGVSILDQRKELGF